MTVLVPRNRRLAVRVGLLCSLFLGFAVPGPSLSGPPSSDGEGARTAPKAKSGMRVAAAQPRNRTIDFPLKPAEALAAGSDLNAA